MGSGAPLAGCVRCGPVGAGRKHYGRGLCRRCGDWLYRHDRAALAGYPPRNRRGADLVADALELRERHGEPGWGGARRWGLPPDRGITWAQIADQLGVGRSALIRAVQRHRAASRACDQSSASVQSAA